MVDDQRIIDTDPVSSQYELTKELAPDTFLVRRKSDGQLFLGYPWDVETTAPGFHALMQRGANDAVLALLNHSNLISHVDTIHSYVTRRGELAHQTVSLTDYCAAGTLWNFMEKTPVQPVINLETNRVQKWLPESLCWHVALSMLKALAWLHEGFRDEDVIAVMQEIGAAWQKSAGETARGRGEDWMPVLHRGVNATNIYFQKPQGSETYGLCKLGNFGEVFVSGHIDVAGAAPVVCSEDGECRLEEVIENVRRLANGDSIFDIEKVSTARTVFLSLFLDFFLCAFPFVHVSQADSPSQPQRPYFKGTELHRLGEILYQMMTRQVLPDREECPSCGVRHWQERAADVCPIWPGGVFQLDTALDNLAVGYTHGLVQVLDHLLSFPRSNVRTEQVLGLVKERYLTWKRDGPERDQFRDAFDDRRQRLANRAIKESWDRRVAEAQNARDAVDYAALAMQFADRYAEAEAQEVEAQLQQEAQAQAHAQVRT